MLRTIRAAFDRNYEKVVNIVTAHTNYKETC